MTQTDERPTHLDLFSGIGGFALAARWAGFRTVGFCEIEPYCQRVLAKNFGALLADPERGGECWGDQPRSGPSRGQAAQLEDWSGAPDQSGYRSKIYRDIFEFDGTTYRGVDLITGGFPCQPYSVAGQRRGAEDDRAIWPQMFRVIEEARPAFVLGENVPGIIALELDRVLSDLEGIGYATRAFVIPACSTGAFHRRNRVWIISYDPKRNGRAGTPQQGSPAAPIREEPARTHEPLNLAGAGGLPAAIRDVPDQHSAGLEGSPQTGDSGREGPRRAEQPAGLRGAEWCQWVPEPNVGRVAHGIPSRMDRIKGLGNAIVPAVAAELLRAIRKLL